jgi:hypothetical protein
MLESRLSEVTEFCDLVKGTCDAIKHRLILGESILSYQKQFPAHKTKEDGFINIG